MANRKQSRPRRDDWAEGEKMELADGREAVEWHNVMTGARVTMLPGVHPMDNQNALAPAPQMPAQLAVNVNASDDDENDGDIDDEDSPADRVAALLSGATGSERADVHIYRIKGDGTEAHCAKIPAHEFADGSYELIRARFGAGKFRLTLYATRPNSSAYVRRASQIIEIEPVREQPTQAASSELVTLLQRMNDRLDRVEQANNNPLAQLAPMLALMKDMREAMGLNQPAPQPQPQHSFASSIKEMMMAIEAMKTIRKEIEPPAPADDDGMTSLAKLAGGVIEIVKANQPNANAVVMPTVTVPAQLSAPAPQPVAVDNPGTDEDEEMRAAFNLAMMTLNAKAKKNGDTNEAAELVYEHAPDDIIELLKTPQWFDALSQAYPAASPYRDWYSRVRAAVLKMLAEDADDSGAAPASKP